MRIIQGRRTRLCKKSDRSNRNACTMVRVDEGKRDCKHGRRCLEATICRVSRVPVGLCWVTSFGCLECFRREGASSGGAGAHCLSRPFSPPPPPSRRGEPTTSSTLSFRIGARLFSVRKYMVECGIVFCLRHHHHNKPGGGTCEVNEIDWVGSSALSPDHDACRLLRRSRLLAFT